jgi:hypothetical protein
MVTSVNVAGQNMLGLAEKSLAMGEGPADGTQMNCSSTNGQSYSCSTVSSDTVSPEYSILSPPGRKQGAMVYDPAAGFVLLFGGLSSGGLVLGDTWSFVNGTWHQVSLTSNSTIPIPAFGTMMTYDPSTGNMILFGGTASVGGSGYVGACYDFKVNGGPPATYTWTLCPTSSQKPGARASGGFVYDSADGYSVLFGGIGSSGPLGDTWTYANGQWNTVGSAGPSPRFNFTMVYDSADGYVLLHGGETTVSCPGGQMNQQTSGSCLLGLNDTWEFAGGKWMNITRWSSQAFCIETGEAAGIYDAMDNYTLLFGGSIITTRTGCILLWYSNETWSFSAGNFHLRNPFPFPPGRQGAMMAYDSADGMVVLFGGQNSSKSPVLSDTWTYWAGGWSLVVPPTKIQSGWNPPANESGPNGRQAAAMTYDARDGFPILFGGYNETAYTKEVNYSDTWIQIAGVWNLTSGPGPSARYGASMVYDSADSYVLLFGGWQIGPSGTIALRDTWNYTFTNGWKQLHPTSSPTGRGGAAMTFDSTSGKVIMFGGANVSGSTTKSLCDTWGFVGGSWTKYATASCPTSGPEGRSNASFAYYPAGGYDVLFGGYNWTSRSFLGDSWRFSGGTWTGLGGSPPTPRADAILVFDGVDGYLVLFGGQGLPCNTTTVRCKQLGDTWTFMSGIWTNITGSLGAGPKLQSEAAATYDAASRYILMFGGIWAPKRTNTVSGSNEWTYWTNGWQGIHSTLTYLTYSAPGERSEEALAYNGPTRSVVMYGGVGPDVKTTLCWTKDDVEYGQNLSDTWSFIDGYGTNITARVGSSLPAPRYGASMVYDERDGYVVMFGGLTYIRSKSMGNDNGTCPVFGDIGDTWAFTGGHWTELKPTSSPIPRAYFGMVYDPVDQYVLLYGGFNNSIGDLGDSWSLSAGQWHELNVTGPSVRDTPDMVFDASDGYVLLWGGFGPSGGTCTLGCWNNDTWTYAHLTWTQLNVTTRHPWSPEHSSGLVYVPDRQTVVMFGGLECRWQRPTGIACNATWEYHAGVWTNVTTWFTHQPLTYPGALAQPGITTDYGADTGFMFGGYNWLGGQTKIASNAGWYLT